LKTAIEHRLVRLKGSLALGGLSKNSGFPLNSVPVSLDYEAEQEENPESVETNALLGMHRCEFQLQLAPQGWISRDFQSRRLDV
jgi:hypothetical protein